MTCPPPYAHDRLKLNVVKKAIEDVHLLCSRIAGGAGDDTDLSLRY